MQDLGQDITVEQRMLDAMALRARVALHNLANQDTPGFKRSTVRFEEHLAQALQRGEQASAVQPRIVRDDSGTPGQNNVDAMDELKTLFEARLLQDLFARRVKGHFDRLRMAIGGGSSA